MGTVEEPLSSLFTLPNDIHIISFPPSLHPRTKSLAAGAGSTVYIRSHIHRKIPYRIQTLLNYFTSLHGNHRHCFFLAQTIEVYLVYDDLDCLPNYLILITEPCLNRNILKSFETHG
ncbi:unnamed protein product [Acanthoscelides obtectus]|uniref:Uncharacterized protein n=1 Tax=Acanthoscelides obtectus TaxID=200917 RepID=A0A9P0NV54_ACAOB|nr:unnamed protein product [Acanthoscelides obtectus]CAK1649971.1 hypothetical protein AOBTE_LOCUS16520 [Acanthoscelides obtectus]